MFGTINKSYGEGEQCYGVLKAVVFRRLEEETCLLTVWVLDDKQMCQ
jgi:sulfur relay (sulfurtransferase) DsrF/TusC family protein